MIDFGVSKFRGRSDKRMVIIGACKWERTYERLDVTDGFGIDYRFFENTRIRGVLHSPSVRALHSSSPWRIYPTPPPPSPHDVTGTLYHRRQRTDQSFSGISFHRRSFYSFRLSQVSLRTFHSLHWLTAVVYVAYTYIYNMCVYKYSHTHTHPHWVNHSWQEKKQIRSIYFCFRKYWLYNKTLKLFS